MKICFFCNISSTLKGDTIGGGELQISLLAKALALKGHEVIIIDPYSRESFCTKEGVKVINVPDWHKGIRGFRMFFYRIPALWKVFAEQNADYYYVRMRSFLHLIPYRISKKKDAKFVLAIASDLDVLNSCKKFKYSYKPNFNILKFLTVDLPNDLVFNYLLKKASVVTLQHSGQKFKSKSSKSNQVLFPNIIDISTLPIPCNSKKSYFIYAGSLTMLKGADNLFNLINIINESVVIMIVGLPNDEKSQLIYKNLAKKENVILTGKKRHTQTLELISNAKALINTSYFEGFPNVFLEAWGMGVPVISLTVNPGNIFDKYKLGICCNGDLKKMKNYMETNGTDCIDKCEIRAYVEKFHDFKTAADRFLSI